jgi:hypothetical protein
MVQGTLSTWSPSVPGQGSAKRPGTLQTRAQALEVWGYVRGYALDQVRVHVRLNPKPQTLNALDQVRAHVRLNPKP